jgi:hypothetical protein
MVNIETTEDFAVAVALPDAATMRSSLPGTEVQFNRRTKTRRGTRTKMARRKCFVVWSLGNTGTGGQNAGRAKWEAAANSENTH